MPPVFESHEPCALPEKLQWYIPPRAEVVGKPLMLVGKPIGLNCHRVGRRTWPCLHHWKKLGIECPNCERVKRWVCWIPLLTIHPPRRRIIVLGGMKTWESIKDKKQWSVTEFHMARVIRLTPVFKLEATQLGGVIYKQLEKEHVPDNGDITEWLLHYWQWPFLSKLFGQAFRESVKTRMIREQAERHRMDDFAEFSPGLAM